MADPPVRWGETGRTTGAVRPVTQYGRADATATRITNRGAPGRGGGDYNVGKDNRILRLLRRGVDGEAMKPTLLSLLALLASLVVAGGVFAEEKEGLPAVARDILARVKQFELYSLEPESEKPGAAGRLHGWKVLGKTTVKDAKARKGLIEALTKGVGKGEPKKCFEPRHAIRATHGGKTVDLVICFACSWVRVYEGNKRIATVTVAQEIEPAFD